jgi:hypothetical protein
MIVHPDGNPVPDIWGALVKAAGTYQQQADFANPITALTFGAAWRTYAEKVGAATAVHTGKRAAVADLIQQSFGKSASAVAGDPGFLADWRRIDDSIVALFISPLAGRGLLGPLAELARLVETIVRAGAGDQSLDAPNGLAHAMKRTLMLPPAIFPVFRDQVMPVGVADLLVVRQHIASYELADVSTIENILKGESRKHTTQHTLRTEKDTTSETETTTVTESQLQTDERFDLKNEVSSVLKSDLAVKAGLSATYKYGDVLTVKAKADVAYDKSEQDSAQVSSEYAKDVTSRASSKVTARVLSRQTHKVVELFQGDDAHSYSAKIKNSTGIYQFLTKVYQAQVFNYGKRLMFDIMVPEPAAFLLDAAASQASMQAPVAPDPFTLLPEQLSHNDPGSPWYYGNFIAKYGVSGFTDPPPADRITAAKGLSLTSKADDDRASMIWSGDLKIPDGYRADSISVNGRCYQGYGRDPHGGKGQSGRFQGFKLTVGSASFLYGGTIDDKGPWPVGWIQPAKTTGLSRNAMTCGARGEEGSIAIGLIATEAIDCSITIEVDCRRTDAALDAWKLKVHAAIVDAYNKLLSDYNDRMQALSIQPALKVSLGGNPDSNRRIEQAELKKAAIQIMSRRELTANPMGAIIEQMGQPLLNGGARPVYTYPRPDLGKVSAQGPSIRFFEQAFEWENMSYVFYPSYWARASQWYQLAAVETDDPLFADFLRAGQARVVIPVRPEFIGDVRYYLLTGQIWGGGDMPSISDHDYLPITEEIKAQTGAPAGETPQGDPWMVRVPTSLVYIRDNPGLPEWVRSGNWDWAGK